MNTTIEKEIFDIIGDNHQMTSAETPLRADAFAKSDADKMKNIEKHFHAIMNEMGLDMTDDSLKGTPHRVAKMFITEIFSGLNPDNKPNISVCIIVLNRILILIKNNVFGIKHIQYWGSI